MVFRSGKPGKKSQKMRRELKMRKENMRRVKMRKEKVGSGR